MPPAPSRPAVSSAAGSFRLSAAHEALVYAALGGLLASGAVWLVYHYLIPHGEVMVTHPAETWSLRIHGALAMAALLLIGSLLRQHAAPAWQRRINRASGSVMLGAMLLLTLTGYLLYYAGSEALRDTASWLHWGVGLAMPAVLGLHIGLGGRLRRRL